MAGCSMPRPSISARPRFGVAVDVAVQAFVAVDQEARLVPEREMREGEKRCDDAGRFRRNLPLKLGEVAFDPEAPFGRGSEKQRLVCNFVEIPEPATIVVRAQKVQTPVDAVLGDDKQAGSEQGGKESWAAGLGHEGCGDWTVSMIDHGTSPESGKEMARPALSQRGRASLVPPVSASLLGRAAAVAAPRSPIRQA